MRRSPRHVRTRPHIRGFGQAGTTGAIADRKASSGPAAKDARNLQPTANARFRGSGLTGLFQSCFSWAVWWYVAQKRFAFLASANVFLEGMAALQSPEVLCRQLTIASFRLIQARAVQTACRRSAWSCPPGGGLHVSSSDEQLAKMRGRLPVLHSTTKAWTVTFTDVVSFQVSE